jgi:hypothetical protein
MLAACACEPPTYSEVTALNAGQAPVDSASVGPGAVLRLIENDSKG